MFGPWSIEPADEFEVLTYRVGLTATMAGNSPWQGSASSPVSVTAVPDTVLSFWSWLCAAFVGSAVITSTTGGSADAGAGAAAALLNPLCVLGALGLGVSLVQIHIYVDPLKKALQVRWLQFCRLRGQVAGLLSGSLWQLLPVCCQVAASVWGFCH
jgi:uncharacterized integral membrane protein